MTAMTKTVRNALAWVLVTGKRPKYLHHANFMAVLDRTDDVSFDLENIAAKGPEKTVKPEHVADLETHPMVVKVRELERDGWKVSRNQGVRKVRRGVVMQKPGEPWTMECSVWLDGVQSDIRRARVTE